MKTYNVVWEEEVIEYHSGQVSETQLLEYCKDNKLELPTGIDEFAELVMECAESLDQCEVDDGFGPDPYVTDLSLDEEDEEDEEDEDNADDTSN